MARTASRREKALPIIPNVVRWWGWVVQSHMLPCKHHHSEQRRSWLEQPWGPGTSAEEPALKTSATPGSASGPGCESATLSPGLRNLYNTRLRTWIGCPSSRAPQPLENQDGLDVDLLPRFLGFPSLCNIRIRICCPSSGALTPLQHQERALNLLSLSRTLAPFLSPLPLTQAPCHGRCTWGRALSHEVIHPSRVAVEWFRAD